MNRITRIATAFGITLSLGIGVAACSETLDRKKSLSNLHALAMKSISSKGLGATAAQADCVVGVAEKLTDKELSDASNGKQSDSFTSGIARCILGDTAATTTSTAVTTTSADSSTSPTQATPAEFTETDRPRLETALTKILTAPTNKGGYNMQPDAATCLVAISKNQPLSELASVASGHEELLSPDSKQAFESSLANCIVNPTGTVAP